MPHSTNKKHQNSLEDIEKLKQKLEHTNKNSIQLLGLFAAFITFSFGSIKIFSDVSGNMANSPVEYGGALVIAYGGVLLLFAITLKYILFADFSKHTGIEKFIKYIVPMVYLLFLIAVVLKIIIP